MFWSPSAQEKARKSPMGSRHFQSMPFRPTRTPRIAPTLATLQSVSQPHMLQMLIVSEKEPRP